MTSSDVTSSGGYDRLTSYSAQSMIFSTTFGRTSDGQFKRYFGPVATVGGERRLNVAVTRAKRQVIVVGSMPVGEISTALKAGVAPGSGITPAGYLQLYLAYAQSVSAGNVESRARILDLLKPRPAPGRIRSGPESPFEEDVLEFLEKRGYAVECQVGESGFRIDLSVLHPDPVRGYVLGIECDGATYHSDRSARIRDVWRGDILRKRGWRLHRIWSTRWWYHRAEETEKLEQAIVMAIEVESRSDQMPPVQKPVLKEPDEEASSRSPWFLHSSSARPR